MGISCEEWNKIEVVNSCTKELFYWRGFDTILLVTGNFVTFDIQEN
jgi:hypothetical protein